jgi:CspA family cold shock protein
MTRQVGTVTKWLNHRGIGFITPDGEESEIGKDILVHYSNIKQDKDDRGSSFKSLQEGSRVEFDTTVDPKNEDKLIAINVTGIGGVQCERRKNPTTRRRPNSEAFDLHVGNLKPGATSWRDLKELFGQCGYVDWVDVSNKDGNGIVRFLKEEEAQRAIKQFHGFEFQGEKLEVKFAQKL